MTRILLPRSIIMFLSLVIILSVLTGASAKEYEHTIYIHPNNGTDPECVTSNSSSISCNSLSSAFNVSHRASSTQYVLLIGTHYLDQFTPTFEGLTTIAFSGSGKSFSDTVIHCTSNTAGLAFENVTDIMFSNITFFNCSAIRNSTSKNIYQDNSTSPFYVALYFYSCRNVNMSFIKVDHSPNATGVVMYDTDGTNTITDSVFSNNSIDPENHSLSGGGGFYVEFTYCIPGDINCKNEQNTVISHTSRNTRATYIFDNCSFLNNNARAPQVSLDNSTTFIVPFRADHVAFGRGGGLSIFVKANASNNLFSINQCQFIDNSALWGAGLFVEFHDDTLGNEVSVTGATMKRNQCFFTAESGTGGGGMRLGHYVYGNLSHNENTTGNHIHISNCNFMNNSALNGGGLSISPTVQNVNQNQITTVLISKTVFSKNHARLGAALHIDKFVMILDGLILTVVMDDCTFNSNSVNYAQYLRDRYDQTVGAYQTGVGAVYVNQVPVRFNGDTTFRYNNGSALAAVGTSLDFSDCTADFFSNMGYKGGAIALLGMAYIKINDQTVLYFLGNVATVDGGAIYNKYIERENLISYGNCFIRHTKYLLDPNQWESIFTFYSNYDQSGAHPNAIHTTSVLPCTWSGGSLVNQGAEKVFCWTDNWLYLPSSTNCSEQISTDVGNVTIALPNISSQIEAFPGQQFNLPITIVDDLNRNMSHQTVFSASMDDYKNETIPTISYIWGQIANVSGIVNSSVKLLLDGLGDRGWHIDLHVTLKDCPPGFKINDQGTECICADNYLGSARCDHDSSKASLKDSTWMGTIPEHEGYVVSLCPPKYCYSNESSSLPNSSKLLENQICGKYNRQGILCGQCLPGYAVAVNSPNYNCVNCTDESIIGSNIAKYIAAVYIPLTAFFTVIILFNIRLTSGPANAFILFSQLLTTTFDLSADGQIPVSQTLLLLYRIPYGIFDLQFFERFIPQLCVGKLNALDVIALDYAVAVYPLIMIIFVIVFIKVKDFLRTSKCCKNKRVRYGIRNVPNFTRAQTSRRRWKVNEAILPAFAAFLLLSYNKFSTTSSYLVGSQPLVSDDGQTVGESRVYYAGNVSFSDVEYRKYLTLASIVFATFVAIPPLLLLDFPIKAFEWCISKFDCLWRRYPADKVQILLDTFQGCYKNKMRFFSGLYFLFRLVINVIYLMTNSWLAQYFVQQIACAVMITLLIICQPYNKENKIFNTIDTLIFLNLAILNSFSFYLYSLTLTNPPNIPFPERPFYFQYFLVYLPLVYMLGYVIWSFLKPYKLRIKRGLGVLKERILWCFNRKDYRPLDGVASDGDAEETEIGHTDLIRNIGNSDEAYSEEEALLRRAESRNRYRSYTSYTVVGINENEGEAAIQPVSSNDSGIRSVQSTPSNNYGSNGNTPRSTSSQTKSESDSRPSVE